MKIIRVILSFFLVFCVFFTIFFCKPKLSEKKEIVEAKDYKGIITIWQIDSFEGGTGSRRQFLLNVARGFERKNKGVLVMVINQTIESAQENFNQGKYPDMVSFGNGLNISNLNEIEENSPAYCKLYGKNLLSIWAKGGYVLFSNKEIKEDFNINEEKVIISQGENNFPLVACIEEGYILTNYTIKSPLDAYVDFVSKRYDYFIGTQRDVFRLKNRGYECYSKPLNNFSDLNQYIAITTSNEEKNYYSQLFIKYLLSKDVQQSLNKIGLFSYYYNVEYADETLNTMSNIKYEYTISPFYSSEKLKEIRELSIDCKEENKDILLKLKNLLV